MTENKVILNILPAPKARARHRVYPKKVTRPGDKPFGVSTYSTPETRLYENSLHTLIRQAYNGKPLDGPVFVEAWFYLPRPKSCRTRRYPHTKPDLDNMVKALYDAAQGVCWTNDSRIVSELINKRYADMSSPTGKPCIVLKWRPFLP